MRTRRKKLLNKFFKLEMLESTNFNNYFEDNKTFYKKGLYKDRPESHTGGHKGHPTFSV